MSLPVIAIILILIVLLIISLWRDVAPKLAMSQSLVLAWLVIALLRLLSLPV